ncbi:MAG: flavin reductase family protein [Christensenellaceae bacterium]|jgi:flavin reductase (DIM6/NTAB) family NADH-FMN oxidoreductase RutF|nr:flavin reductase family protein [Christensenellaceae bacterium]
MKRVLLTNGDSSPAKVNKFCPQALFLYGTYKEDGSPNFGLFSWISYAWDGELCVMACIGEEKLTKDRIHATGVFSANLVSEELLPLADWFGNHEGYTTDKAAAGAEVERGSALNVPLLAKSPWSFELELKRSIPLDGGEIFLCRIASVTADERLADETLSVEARAALVTPAIYMGINHYAGLRPEGLGAPGDWKEAR